MRLDNKNLQTVLLALGEQVAARTDNDIGFVVCGGSALQALGLVERTTRDVDVLALVQTEGSEPLRLVTAEPLPTVLWTITQDALDVFPDIVRDFLRKTGFPDVADRL